MGKHPAEYDANDANCKIACTSGANSQVATAASKAEADIRTLVLLCLFMSSRPSLAARISGSMGRPPVFFCWRGGSEDHPPAKKMAIGNVPIINSAVPTRVDADSVS